MSSSSVVALSSFNLLFFTQVLTVLTTTIKYSEYVTDKGKNISIPCIADGNIMWVRENGTSSTIIQTGKFLVLTNVSTADRGLYICFASVPPRNGTDLALEDDSSDNADASDAETQSNADDTDENTTSGDAIQTKSTSSALPWHTKANHGSIASTTTSLLPTPHTVVSNNALANETSNKNNNNSTMTYRVEEQEFRAFQKVNLTVRTPPGPVTQLYFKASTILGFLIWRYNKTNSGGYPVRSFTAEYRNVSYTKPPYNSSFEHHWSRMDPINIAPNVRQMEVYHLAPNITYEFRIWANNQLGSGEVVTTNVTTLPETNEEDLIRLIQPDLDNFDPRVWIVAVSIVLGTLVILAIGLCIVLSKECYQSAHPGTNKTVSNVKDTALDDCKLDVVVVNA